LLTGERAHYELAAGRKDEAERLLHAMENFAGDEGLISEQVWDKPDIPERELFPGRPSGSAMPLVWAHAEYVKLRRSLESGHVFDLPSQTYERYVAHRNPPRFHVWRFNQKCRVIPPGRLLRVETHAASVVHWSGDGWETSADAPTRDTGIGIHVAEIPVSELPDRSEIVFTFFWPEVDRWEGANFTVEIRSD
jgi:glucoamylase